VTVYKHNPLESRSIGSNGITSILRTSTGKLLIGTFGGGIALLDPQEKFFTNFRHNPSDTTTITSDYVIALFEDSLGMIWVGTENGLNRFQLGTGKFERFYTERNNPQSLPSDMVWAFHEDSNQTLWLGTKGGSLSSWEVNQRRRSIREFNNYSEKIALPSSNIYGIKNDSNGNLWLSHNRGVTRFNPITFKSRQFGIRDGLQDNEFNMGASFKSSTGSILFGGNRGYNVITAENLEDTTSPPEVNISSIKIMNETRRFEKPYHSLDKLELGYEDRMVSIEFYATDYTSPDLTTYAYKLEGINPDWIVSKEARIASFTTLPAGKYNLLLAAASPDGAWNWEAKKLPIVVHPPPWQSPIAYAIYAVVLTAIAWGIAYRQRRQAALALERQKELEAKVQERTADLEKAREVAVQASKAKSEFLATMSHEIRTPMHGMIGMTELLLHTELSEQQKQFANAAHNSGESLLGLINEILDFSKLEASKVELEIVDFSLYELVDEVCYLQGEPAQRKGLNLTNIYTSKLPKLVAGDPAKIRQVLMNLTSNSIKFTHKGNVSVKISCSDKLKENGLFTADITVTDDGIGMDEETQTKVFEAFTQADASTTREYGGTGLGLAISRQYVDLMGGEIHVKSKLGVGTQITISVPLESKSEPQTATPLNATLVAEVYCEEKNTREMIRSQLEIVGIEATDDTTIHGSQGDSSSERIRIVDLDSYDIKLVDSLKGSSNNQHKGIALTKLAQVAPPKDLENWIVLGKPLTGSLLDDALSRYLGSSTTEQQPANLKPRPADENQKVILVAEDVETNQKIAREMIEMLGCKVKIAENGLDAFEQFKQTNFDLVFMDCQMPVMDGFQSTRSIRKYEEENKITPTPIVALTAGINQSDREDCKSSGMDQYLTKPFSIAELKDAIEICSGSIDKKSTAPPPKQPELSSDADTPSDDTLFNYTAIENLIEVERQTGNKILPEIFNGFTSQMESKLKELENDITGKDFEAMYKTAHAIKSMSANIGAKKVREISLEVESKGKAGEPIDYTPFLNLLQTEYQEFRTAFENRFLD
jgi:signal transduction histidine kinase/HPt (histidine-containing phosphotransfer) domain-containing protein/ActR/RegA family two-component response regulator